MEYYTKQEEVSLEQILPFPKELTEDIVEMNVKEGTKFKNILGFVERKFQDPSCRRIIFKGVGEATAKCISCVEVFKRSYKEELYQWNSVSFSRRTDVWGPGADKQELSKILVHVDVPTVFILISRDPFPAEYINDSCQSTFEELNGFACNKRGFNNSRNPPKRPHFKESVETNKWKRSHKKRSNNSNSRLSSSNKS